MRKRLTIILGFGGSGGKTVKALAKHLTNNPASARLAHERIHVVLCDTDEGDLESAGREVQQAFDQRCPGYTLPVEKFSLADNADFFSDLVQEKINKITENSPQNLMTLKEHWWFKGKIPFSATALPLTVAAGAGQCPLVSHFLAWANLGNFERVLERIDRYSKNSRGMEDYAVDLLLVSSMAGGTGRGCWQILSLKAREYFGRLGQPVQPFGFFFDQSVFSDIQEGRPEQAVKLRVNSLTGWSELAMWLRSGAASSPVLNEKSDAIHSEKRFALPNLDNPADFIIDTDRYMPQHELARVGRNPIRKAFVFTNQSSSMHVRRSDDVYALCGAVLYGKIVVSQTKSADQNDTSRAAATATSILYVPISAIQELIRDQTRAMYAERLCIGGRGVKMKFEDGVRFILEDAESQSVAEVVRTFKSAFAPPSEANFKSPTSGSICELLANEFRRPDKDGKQGAYWQSKWPDFVKALEKGVKLKESIEGLLSYSNISAHVQKKYSGAIVRWLNARRVQKLDNGQNFESICSAIVQQLWSGERDSILHLCKRSGVSLGLISCVLDQLQASTLELLQATRAELKIAGENPAKDAKTLTEEVLKYRRGFPASLFESFSSAAHESVGQRVAQEATKALLPTLLKQHIELLNTILAAIDRSRAHLQRAVDLAANASRRFRTRFEQQIPQHFVDIRSESNPSEDALASRMVAERVLRQMNLDEANAIGRMLRELRPVYSAKTAETLKTQFSAGSAVLNDSLRELVEKYTGIDPAAGEVRGLYDTNSIICCHPRSASDSNQIDRAFDAELNSLLSRVDVGGEKSEFAKNFYFVKVLSDLFETWMGLYEANRDPKFCTQLDEAVHRLTGLSLKAIYEEAKVREEKGVDSGMLKIPDDYQILAHTSLMLADKCDPLVRLSREDNRKGDRVQVFLPSVPGNPLDKTFDETRIEIARILPNWSGGKQFQDVRVNKHEDNPFMLIANCDQPKVDFIQNAWDGWPSFDYHRDDSRLTPWLKMVEDPSGASVFEEGRDDSVGLGYLMPAFVTSSHWASRRWRPWFRDGERWTQDRLKWMALAYALFGNEMYASDGERTKNDEDKPFLKDYQEVLKKVRELHPVNSDHRDEEWTLPLLEEKAGGKGPQFKRALFTQKGQNKDYRRNGLDLTKLEQSASVRKFIEWFEDSATDKDFAEILKEQALFAKIISERKDHMYSVLSPRHIQSVRKALREFVAGWRLYIEKHQFDDRDRKQQVEFLDRLDTVLADEKFNIFDAFDGSSTGAN